MLRCLREVCADGQLLVDLFVNYDCDLDSSNLFERLVNGLVKMAQAALPVNADSQQVSVSCALLALSCSADRGAANWHTATKAWLLLINCLHAYLPVRPYIRTNVRPSVWLQVQQEQWLRQEALQCLASSAEALLKWYRQMSGLANALAALPGSSGGAVAVDM